MGHGSITGGWGWRLGTLKIFSTSGNTVTLETFSMPHTAFAGNSNNDKYYFVTTTYRICMVQVHVITSKQVGCSAKSNTKTKSQQNSKIQHHISDNNVRSRIKIATKVNLKAWESMFSQMDNINHFRKYDMTGKLNNTHLCEPRVLKAINCDLVWDADNLTWASLLLCLCFFIHARISLRLRWWFSLWPTDDVLSPRRLSRDKISDLSERDLQDNIISI